MRFVIGILSGFLALCNMCWALDTQDQKEAVVHILSLILCVLVLAYLGQTHKETEEIEHPQQGDKPANPGQPSGN